MARKGSPLHVKAGWWYANAMYIVSISALVISVMVFISPMAVKYSGNEFELGELFRIAQRERTFSLFLLAISVLVLASVRHGLLTIKSKKDHSLMRSPGHLALNGALGLLGVALIFLGAGTGFILAYIFAGICLIAGISQLRYCLKKEVARMEWMVAHLGAMCGAGIGSYTAFFVFGGNRYLSDILTGNLQIIPWVAPAILGTFFINQQTRKYRKQFKF
ncbi:MAG: hypothetical protein AAF438_03965 [Pseudomonadota bacterium]